MCDPEDHYDEALANDGDREIDDDYDMDEFYIHDDD